MQFFQDLMPSLNLSRWTPAVLRKHLLKEETKSIESLCRMMMKSDGEYSSLFLAERILNAFDKLDYRQRLDFFSVLLVDYDIDTVPTKRVDKTVLSRECPFGSQSEHVLRLRATGYGDNLCPTHFGQLNRSGTDTARSADHGQRLAPVGLRVRLVKRLSQCEDEVVFVERFARHLIASDALCSNELLDIVSRQDPHNRDGAVDFERLDHCVEGVLGVVGQASEVMQP